ncbi:Uncharacterised protein [Mycobacterium tuberculosis]|nr:Uncharacterised protein [Mycobacterium tuberculosis]
MTFYKVNTVIILNHSILTEFFFPFNTHTILSQHPFNIAIIFLDILGDVINPLLINLPTTVRIDFTSRHHIRLVKMFW